MRDVVVGGERRRHQLRRGPDPRTAATSAGRRAARRTAPASACVSDRRRRPAAACTAPHGARRPTATAPAARRASSSRTRAMISAPPRAAATPAAAAAARRAPRRATRAGRRRCRRPASGTGRRAVTPSMPANTAMPIAWRISAPAPVENTSGTTPMMNATDVISTGRSRTRQASRIARRARSSPSSSRCLANSTIRIAFLQASAGQHQEADLREDVVVAAGEPHAGDRREQRHRHDQDHAERQRPALVLRRQHDVDEQHAQREDRAASCCRRASPDRPARSTRRSCRAAAAASQHLGDRRPAPGPS